MYFHGNLEINMLRRLMLTGIIMLFLFGSVNKCGYFKGKTFDNSHIIVKIEKDYAVIKDSESKEILVERAYPVIQLKIGERWEAVELISLSSSLWEICRYLFFLHFLCSCMWQLFFYTIICGKSLLWR